MNGAQVYKRLQSMARSIGAKSGVQPPTEEYLVRHALESFLDRLNRTPHALDFVLKGGILLAAYGARRPTRDVDAEAVNTSLTIEHLTVVVRDVVALEVDDGVVFDLESLTIREKHKAFRSERETRYLVSRPSNPAAAHPTPPDREHVVVTGAASDPFDLGWNLHDPDFYQASPSLLPIREIRIGPRNGFATTARWLRGLLDAQGYSAVKLRQSSSPLK